MSLGGKVNQKFVLVTFAIAGLFAGGATALAQNRPYDVVMKDIGAAFGILTENLNEDGEEEALDADGEEEALDADGAAAAIAAADELDGLFEEVEAFWAKFNTTYAVDLATDAREGAAAVRDGASANNIEMARDGYQAMQTTCRNCHYTHREITDSGFRIRP